MINPAVNPKTGSKKALRSISHGDLTTYALEYIPTPRDDNTKNADSALRGFNK